MLCKLTSGALSPLRTGSQPLGISSREFCPGSGTDRLYVIKSLPPSLGCSPLQSYSFVVCSGHDGQRLVEILHLLTMLVSDIRDFATIADSLDRSLVNVVDPGRTLMSQRVDGSACRSSW